MSPTIPYFVPGLLEALDQMPLVICYPTACEGCRFNVGLPDKMDLIILSVDRGRCISKTSRQHDAWLITRVKISYAGSSAQARRQTTDTGLSTCLEHVILVEYGDCSHIVHFHPTFGCQARAEVHRTCQELRIPIAWLTLSLGRSCDKGRSLGFSYLARLAVSEN